MPRVTLTGGAYQARSLIAACQRCCNLYPETNPPEAQSPAPVTHYQFPGLTLNSVAPNIERVRQLYRATNGDLYEVVGPQVYFVSPLKVYTLLGTIPDLLTPTSMTDNGSVIVLVDGTTTGYAIDMASHAFGRITDPNFLGASHVDQIDTFFVFNVVGTFKFYISLSEVNFAMLTQTAIGTGNISAPGSLYTNGVYQGVPLTGGSGTGAAADITIAGAVVTAVDLADPGQGYLVGDVLSALAANIGGTGSGFTWTVATPAPAFDPLDIASKSSTADPIQSLIVVHDELWLVGELTTEVWINSGAADFTLQKLPGTFIEHGCVAQYSLIANGNSAFWLSQDRKGKGKVFKTQGYETATISTKAIEVAFQSYAVISDAIGMCLQIEGHIFYILVFPTADKSWAFDIEEGRWFELVSIDQNGVEHRTRANCCAFAYGEVFIGDWQNGSLYELDPDNYTENGNPIKWVRTFPHMMNNGVRVTYQYFTADMEVGNLPGLISGGVPQTDFNSDFNSDFLIDGTLDSLPQQPLVFLRWSSDRGRTFSDAVSQPAGAEGQYDTWITWWEQGEARDMVYELSWSFPAKTALNGAFVNTIPHKS